MSNLLSWAVWMVAGWVDLGLDAAIDATLFQNARERFQCFKWSPPGENFSAPTSYLSKLRDWHFINSLQQLTHWTVYLLYTELGLNIIDHLLINYINNRFNFWSRIFHPKHMFMDTPRKNLKGSYRNIFLLVEPFRRRYLAPHIFVPT